MLCLTAIMVIVIVFRYDLLIMYQLVNQLLKDVVQIIC